MKKLFNLIFFLFLFSYGNAQSIVTQDELSQKQDEYFLQPTYRNGVGVKRSIPFSTVKNFIAASSASLSGDNNFTGLNTFSGRLSIANNLNTVNYTWLNLSFQNNTAAMAELYFDYTYRANFGPTQSRRFLTVKNKNSIFSDTLTTSIFKLPTNAGANKIMFSDAMGLARWDFLSFAQISSKPTTLAGYGITDVITNSVFGRTGAVTAQSGDYTFAQIGSKPTTLAGYGITDVITNSVFGRTGAVTAQNGDYTFAQIGSKPTTLAGYGITDAANLAGATFTGQVNLAISSGNVGIGTASPLSKADIRGDVHISNGSTTKTRLRTGGIIDFTNFAESAYADAIINGNNISILGNSGAGIYINSVGSLGIGISAPSSKLHLYGTGYVQGTVQTTSTIAGALSAYITGSRSYTVGSRSDFSTGAFHIVDETAAVSRLMINNGGYVGIGTITPTSLLHNAGSEASKISIISGATTLGEHNLIVASGSSSYLVTLPDASTCTGRKYYIKTLTANKTISTFLNQNNISTTTLTAGTSILIASDGTNWQQF